MTKCISCNHSETVSIGKISIANIFAGRVTNKVSQSSELLKCNSCKLLFRYPQLKKEEYDVLYKNGSSENWQDVANERNDWKSSKQYIDKHIENGKVLDVGCYDGKFLKSLAEKNKLYGIEIHSVAKKIAHDSGIDIIHDDYVGLIEKNYNFDAITSFDVIEHTLEPFTFLQTLSNNISDDGVIIIGTGNTNALSWRIMGAKYWYCTISEHLVFINPEWCAIAAKKLNLQFIGVSKLSHKNLSFKRKVIESIANIIFRYTPKAYILLRKLRSNKNHKYIKGVFHILGINTLSDEEINISKPPPWVSAKDHMICAFRKDKFSSS